jgi:hypothetical protein
VASVLLLAFMVPASHVRATVALEHISVAERVVGGGDV